MNFKLERFIDGYVAVGINYTLRTDTNEASVLTQSNEIKEAIPVAVEEAKKLGYNIDELPWLDLQVSL